MLNLLVNAWRERGRWFSGVARRAHKIWRDWRGLLLFVAIMLVFRSAVADWNQVPSGSMKPGILDGDRIVVDKLAWDLRVPFTDLRIAQWSNPARGDVVTFVNPLDGRLFVKRVVAVPGDVVELRMKQLIVNGERARYTRLPKEAVRELPIENAHRYHFYREDLLGESRVVMMHSEPGRHQLRGNRLTWLGRESDSCEQFRRVAAAGGDQLALAICRCADRGQCADLPSFTVPEGKYWMMGDNRDNSSDSRAIGFIDREIIYGRAHAIAFSVDRNQYYRPRFHRFFTDLTDPPDPGAWPL